MVVSRFSVETYLSRIVEKVPYGESFSVSLISGLQKNWIRVGGVLSRFSVETYLSHSFEEVP